jgi:hypothetical protein
MRSNIVIVALIMWFGVGSAHAAGDDGSPQCSPGEWLMPAVGGVKCQKRVHCAPNESMVNDAEGFRCERTPQHLSLSRRYYAFVPTEGDPLCVAWGSPFDGDDQSSLASIPHEAHVSGQPWWVAWAYRLDLPNRTFSISKLYAVEDRQFVQVPANIVVSIYESPQSGWPCTAKMWKALLEWPPPPPPPQEYVTVPTITLNPACGNPPGYRPSSCIFH